LDGLLGLLFDSEENALASSETVMNVYRTTRRYIPEDLKNKNMLFIYYVSDLCNVTELKYKVPLSFIFI
jgi:hypothetical protein